MSLKDKKLKWWVVWAAVAVLAGVGYLTWSNQLNAERTYSNSDFGFSFKYSKKLEIASADYPMVTRVATKGFDKLLPKDNQTPVGDVRIFVFQDTAGCLTTPRPYHQDMLTDMGTSAINNIQFHTYANFTQETYVPELSLRYQTVRDGKCYQIEANLFDESITGAQIPPSGSRARDLWEALDSIVQSFYFTN